MHGDFAKRGETRCPRDQWLLFCSGWRPVGRRCWLAHRSWRWHKQLRRHRCFIKFSLPSDWDCQEHRPYGGSTPPPEPWISAPMRMSAPRARTTLPAGEIPHRLSVEVLAGSAGEIAGERKGSRCVAGLAAIDLQVLEHALDIVARFVERD